MRALLVRVHRYTGLVLAGFLIVAGLTGSLLAWNDELDAWISPRLFQVAPPAPDAAPLDPLDLRDRVQQAYPQALVARVPLTVEPGRSVLFILRRAPTPADGQAVPLPNDQVFVDPYTGAVLGERKWGDIGQGTRNLMPFIYRLHFSLALDVVGTWVFGAISLVWVVDCFVGASLTWPRRLRKPAAGAAARPRGESRKSWLARWRPSWLVRRGRGYAFNFDLHRAGGLWLWAMLLVLAWSSVAFNLAPVYDPVMKAALAHQPDLAAVPRLPKPRTQPAIGWARARDLARTQMAEQARRYGFTVQAETALLYDPVRGLYRYDVKSSRDIRDRGANTRMALDGDTGALKGLWLPTGAASGDTVRTWITNLHMAAVGGIAMKILIGALGLAVALLSVTGILIWARKRRARRGTAAPRTVARTHRPASALNDPREAMAPSPRSAGL